MLTENCNCEPCRSECNRCNFTHCKYSFYIIHINYMQYVCRCSFNIVGVNTVFIIKSNCLHTSVSKQKELGVQMSILRWGSRGNMKCFTSLMDVTSLQGGLQAPNGSHMWRSAPITPTEDVMWLFNTVWIFPLMHLGYLELPQHMEPILACDQ